MPSRKRKRPSFGDDPQTVVVDDDNNTALYVLAAVGIGILGIGGYLWWRNRASRDAATPTPEESANARFVRELSRKIALSKIGTRLALSQPSLLRKNLASQSASLTGGSLQIRPPTL